MFNKTKFIKGEKAVMLFLLFILQACSYQEVNLPFPQSNEIKKGKKFCVILPENHNGTAFWHVTQKNFVAVESLNSVWHGNEKGIYFNFLAKNSGVDTLYFFKRQMQDTVEEAKYIVKVIE